MVERFVHVEEAEVRFLHGPFILLRLHNKIYILCSRTKFMVFTEIKVRNGIRYYYRVLSMRDGQKIRKKRVYLGVNLDKKELLNKEIEADKKILTNEMGIALRNMLPKIIRVLRKYNVKRAGVFGSYAREQNKKNSDIDIIIEPPKNMGIEFVKLNYELEESLKRKVDLITYRGVNPRIKKYILNDEVKII